MNRKTGWILVVLAAFIMGTNIKQQRQYVCLPCVSSCDAELHTTPGTCQHCHMPLVDKATVIFKKVQPTQLCNFITSRKQVLLLDVRTPEEFAGTAEEKFGRLKNAVNIPVQQLEQRVKELSKYKNYDIVVYCSHSHRSPRASYILNQHGFKKVTNMEGGMSVWKEQVKENNCSGNLYVSQ